MNSTVVNTVKTALDDLDISLFSIRYDDGYYVMNSESTLVLFDDGNEVNHIFRNPNDVKHAAESNKTVEYACRPYEKIQEIRVVLNATDALELADKLGLSLEDDEKEFILTIGNAQNLTPIQNFPNAEVNAANRPFIPSVL